MNQTRDDKFEHGYGRGVIMGLTVAESFVLLVFCLLLLFIWWQTTETDNAADYSRLMRQEDARRIMGAAAKLSPDTLLRFANVMEALNESQIREMLTEKTPENSKTAQIAEHIEAVARAQKLLVLVLERKLGETIRAAGGKIDERGTIVLPQTVLFDRDKDVVKNPAFLRQICVPWLETLRAADLNISELRIEGHASSEGPAGASADQSFLYNLDLSQRRAQNALAICLANVQDEATQEWARRRLTAIGYSSTHPVFGADGQENLEESRRVMLSVALNQERLIADIKHVLSQTTPVKTVGAEERH